MEAIMISAEKYLEAIENLKLGMTQLKPDGNCCHICGDNDHQAWECALNPLSNSYHRFHSGWKCYHCDQVFTD